MNLPLLGSKSALVVCVAIAALAGCQSTPTESMLGLSGAPAALRAEADWVPLSTSMAMPQADPSPGAPYDNIYRRFELGLGGLALATFNTTLQVGSSSLGAGAVLDLEDALGVDSKTTSGRLDVHYAFNRRSSLEFSAYDIRRDGRRILGEDIEFGDKVIPAGPLDTQFNTLVVKLAYRHNLVADVRTVIAVSAGFHVMGVETGLKSETFNVEEDLNVTVPLPVLGVHAAYALNHKWKVTVSAEFFRVALGDFTGSLTDSQIRIEHDPFKHFGWGVGLNGFIMDLGIDDGDVFADLEYGYQGLMLYVRTFF